MAVNGSFINGAVAGFPCFPDSLSRYTWLPVQALHCEGASPSDVGWETVVPHTDARELVFFSDALEGGPFTEQVGRACELARVALSIGFF